MWICRFSAKGFNLYSVDTLSLHVIIIGFMYFIIEVPDGTQICYTTRSRFYGNHTDELISRHDSASRNYTAYTSKFREYLDYWPKVE